MKVFCSIIIFLASTFLAQDVMPKGVTIQDIWKQTCIDFNKAKMSAAKGGEGCEIIATADPNAESSSIAGLVKKFVTLVKGYNCFIKANNLTNENGDADLEKVKSAIDSVATSQEKADAIKNNTKTCVGDSTTVTKDKSKTCHPVQ